MRDYFKPKTWLITTLMLIMAFSLSSAIVYYEFGFKKNIKIIRAIANDNVSGWAWSSNIGWISFNCTEDDPACGASDYGVSINLNTGHFSGYAWSSNVGWISFNETDAPDYAFNASCVTASSCSALNNCTACYRWSDRKVYGWGKILSMGNDGWIKFNGNKQDELPWVPGVTINPATNDFSGWAWNANDNGSGIGWISFNCDHTADGTSPPYNINTCGTSNYKTIGEVNRQPTVVDMTAPNWNYKQASDEGALHANLNFRFVDNDSGSFGSKYQIIIKKADDTPVLDTGECTGYNTPSANPVQCIFNTSIACMENGSTGCIDSANCVCQFPLTQTDGIWYGTGYKWSVKVWDNYGVASILTPYNINPDSPLVADDRVVPTFTTYKHNFPLPNSTPFPANPSQGEKVKFTDSSQRFFSAPPVNNPTTAVNCTSATCVWEWTVPVNATIDDVATSTPIITFNSTGTNTVTLRVRDKVGVDTGNTPYYTDKIIKVEVRAKLPGWREVKPE